MATVGIIGGTGALGSAMARAWLDSGTISPSELWVSNRSGEPGPLAGWPEVTIVKETEALVEAADTLVLAVPPAAARELILSAADALVVSVMAGITLAEMRRITGSERLARAMSSPAAAIRLAYSPWTASNSLGTADVEEVTRLLSATGLTDRVDCEDHIDRFTAITGPVPGIVAAFADAVVAHATKHGIPKYIAVRAVRQLFHSAGNVMVHDDRTPRDHVDEMIDYDGTTAAGLRELDAGTLANAIDQGLDAAYQRAKTI